MISESKGGSRVYQGVMKSAMRVHSKVVAANPTRVMRARLTPMTKSRYDKT